MGKQELINQITEMQARFGHTFGRHPTQHLMSLGLTMPQLKSLMSIVQNERTTSKKLADIMGVTPPNITGVVERLVQQGMVRREANPEDRRVEFLEATEAGKKVVTNLRESTQEHMQKLLSQLDEEELECLLKGSIALLRAAENLRQQEVLPPGG
jgi:MarR family transcriptional regulator, organic hydroperoxide resistance regulator